MRHWALLGILSLALLLQTTVVPYLEVFGLVPDVLLAAVVTFGLLFGPEAGLSAGMGIGLMLDLVGGRFIGLSVLTLGVAGLLAGQVEKRVFKDNWLLPLSAGFLGTLVKEGLTMLILLAFNWRIPVLEALREQILPAALYNALVTLVVYFRILRHYRYLRPDPRGQIPFVRKR